MAQKRSPKPHSVGLLVLLKRGRDGTVTVLVQEQKLLVGSKGPEIGRARFFGIVAEYTHFNHGLETKDTGLLGLLVGSAMVELSQFGLQLGHACLKLSKRTNASSLEGRNDVLVDHVNQANVALMLNLLAGKALGLTESAHLGKEIKILLGRETSDRLDT
jgi:hypothetical protein